MGILGDFDFDYINMSTLTLVNRKVKNITAIKNLYIHINKLLLYFSFAKTLVQTAQNGTQLKKTHNLYYYFIH